MKKGLLFCIALFSFNISQATIIDYCDPCFGWDFNIDWLYWNIRRSDLDFAIDGHTATGFPNGKIKCLDVNYDNGFRIGAVKKSQQFDLALRYTHFKTDNNCRSIERIGDIVATRLHPGNAAGIGDVNTMDYAQASFKASIDSMEFELGKKIEVDGQIFARPVFGFRYTGIYQSMKTIYQEDDAGVIGVQVKDQLEMNAYGFYVGIGGQFDFCTCYSIFGSFSGGIYASNFDAKYNEYQYNGPHIGVGAKGDRLINTKKSQTLVVCSYDLSLGMSYDLHKFMCMDWKLSAGYEFHNWCGIPGFIHFTDNSSRGTLSRNGSNFGYDGLFVRVNALF